MATFHTPDGGVVPTVTTAQMAEVDRVAVEETGPQLLQMMENAGRSLCLTVLDSLDEFGGRDGTVVVLAGTGGNGGGGLAAARHLANHGVDVAVVVTDVGRLSPAAVVQHHVLSSTSARVLPPSAVSRLVPAVIVDAVLGYGVRGAPHGVAADLIEWAGGHDVPTISLDVPSGIDATTGEAAGIHVSATTTLTLALPKPGLASAAAGSLVLADLGIPPAIVARVGVTVPADLFATGHRVVLTRR